MGDTSKHLTSFKVENFKRFESFEMKDLGQFNLIVGDNNVGKTSVLEALLFSTNMFQTINNLVGALRFRNLISNFTYQDISIYRNVSIKGFNNTHTFGVTYNFGKDIEGIKILIDNNRQELIFQPSSSSGKPESITVQTHQQIGFSQQLNFPFIPFYRGHDEDLTRFYSKLQADRLLKNRFVNDLKILVPEIENIEPSHQFEKPHLIVYQDHINQTLPLAFFGDGTLKLFRLLAEISINRNHRLMIDEIDTGIHFTRFKQFWRVVLKAAKENNVQLFMSTHSEECMRYFVEVLSQSDMKHLQTDSRSILLAELPDKSIKAYSYSFDHLEANIAAGNDVRGGDK